MAAFPIPEVKRHITAFTLGDRAETPKAQVLVRRINARTAPAQALPVIDRFVKEGCQVSFATSFGFMEAVLEGAMKYPNVILAHATGVKRAPNVATYMADFYQVYYLNLSLIHI